MKGPHTHTTQTKDESFQSKRSDTAHLENTLDQITDKMFNQGIAPKEAIGVSNTQAENIYAQAYRLYNTGKYAEATHLFRILIIMNPMEQKYTLGLAAALHMMKDFVAAIQTYTMCSALDPHNPIPHYHSSDCYLQMKEVISAMLSLELAIESCKNKPQYSKIQERCQLSLQSLKQIALSTPLKDIPDSTKGLTDGIFDSL